MRYFNVFKINENYLRGVLLILRLFRLYWLILSGRLFIFKGYVINFGVGVKVMIK